MKNITILGISGSVGSQILDIIRKHPDKYNLYGCSVHNNIEFANSIKKEFPLSKIRITSKGDSLDDIICDSKVDIVANAISGYAGLEPSIKTIENSKILALANKETVVIGGDLFFNLLKKYPKSQVISLDSEHSSLMQLLNNDSMNVHKLIITASGGPFVDLPINGFKNIKLEDAINHPTWSMGRKISIDSATMFNKGLEIIEAHYLFNMPYDKIEAVINRTSKVHALVEYNDGTTKILLSNPAMSLPLSYGLDCNRNLNSMSNLSIEQINEIKLEHINREKFKSIDLAYLVGSLGKNAPLIYCVANEIAVNAFIEKKIKFNDIYDVVDEVVNNSEILVLETINDIYSEIKKCIEKTSTIIERRFICKY